ncbi:MAG: HlyD family secretion protein, partial [Thermoanaerobaculia bacterium]|nr:HlyD family secretion protein [Thermoanaerobaculia bacterium]
MHRYASVTTGIMRQKKSFIAIGLVLILSIIGVLVHRLAFAKETTAYRFATIERGNLQSTVSATGTLNAVTTVSVGTQVSGQVSELLADFNDHVKKGQLLARIDPTLALAAVTDAQANLEKAQAQALQASRDYARNRELTNDGLVARSAYEVSQSGATVANAGVKSARVALDRARQNLSYTSIYAPIDGVVVERNVQQGQTVAASLSAPQLFLIANDLSQMQILAQVGESDIAQIKEGQPVSFTVQALTGQTFKGTVKQVRLQSTTTDNVVNYTVVVSVPNADGKLLPGMTARVQFLTKESDNVLKVSNAALRFKPTDAELAALKAAR